MSFQPRTQAQIEEETARLRAEWTEALPDHFSASATGLIFTCPEQYRQRYILKAPTPPNPNLIWGRGDTKAIEAHFQSVLVEDGGLTKDEVGDAFSTAADEAVEEGGGTSEIVWKTKMTGNESATAYGKLKDAGIKLAQDYHANIAPTVTPIGVEHEFSVTNPLWPVPVVGFLDVLEDDGVVERKTSSKKNSSINTHWRLQGRIYQMAMEKPIRWHQSVKNLGNPAKQVAYGDDPALTLDFSALEAHRTEILVAQAMKEVAFLYSTYGPDSMWPGRGISHPYACGYCSWEPVCPWRNA
jgi:hypothetical protein